MEKGMSVDAGPGVHQTTWGTKIKRVLGFYGGLEDQKSIVSYRCSNCGFLESYAK